MQDRPNAIELLEAAADFIDRDIVPATEGRRQFQARVAANVMRIVAREIEMEEPQLNEELRVLADSLGLPAPATRTLKEAREAALALNQRLSERIRAGEADEGPWRERAFQVMRKLVEEKLKVANPRYLEADLAARAGEAQRAGG
ncbi:MAG: DUF6285 domain-containing protein [Candidatus Binataceae bacterium]